MEVFDVNLHSVSVCVFVFMYVDESLRIHCVNSRFAVHSFRRYRMSCRFGRNRCRRCRCRSYSVGMVCYCYRNHRCCPYLLPNNNKKKFYQLQIVYKSRLLFRLFNNYLFFVQAYHCYCLPICCRDHHHDRIFHGRSCLGHRGILRENHRDFQILGILLHHRYVLRTGLLLNTKNYR